MAEKQKTSLNIKAKNNHLEVLKVNFPHCFNKNGEFELEKFKKEIGDNEIDFAQEGFSLDWVGKSYAHLRVSDEVTTFIKEDRTHNSLEENVNSENVLIKGDNLEVLKHLSHAYYEKIKMIYIDPPYNTGNDGFAYNDSKTFKPREFANLASVDEQRAKEILSFVSSGSNAHSAWLTFMYPRLYIARQLLKEDGVIFISIDENEVAQLKIIMNEIFGEENFVGTIIWKNVTDNNPTNIASEHEYIICFSKNKSKIARFWKSKISDIKSLLVKIGEDLNSKFENQQELQKKYSTWFRENKNQLWPLENYKFIDKNGVYSGERGIHNPGKEGYRYDIIHPKTKKPCKQPLMGYRYPKETMDKMIEEGRIIFGDNEDKLVEKKVYAKDYLQKLSSVFHLDGRAGANELKELFPRVKKIFTNPKTVKLLKELISFAGKQNDLILDFFAGSGTTSDAIMRLNAEDGGNRKYISVQLDEAISKKKNKEVYEFLKNTIGVEPTIFEITKERIIRTSKRTKGKIIKKIDEKQLVINDLNGSLNLDNKEKIIKNNKSEIERLQNQDIGFKVFETVPIWENYKIKAKQFEKDLLIEETLLDDEQVKTLLTTWKLQDGFLLPTSFKEFSFNDYKIYYIDSKMYLMYQDFKTEHLKMFLEKLDSDKSFNIQNVVAFGFHFNSAMLRELKENIKNYKNKKNTELELEIRY